jgi:hypothetical protein
MEALLMQLLEITEHRRGFLSIPVRRKNGDRVYVTAGSRQQFKAAKGLLMKLAKHFRAPLIECADFYGLGAINTANEVLIAALSSVPDPYCGVDFDLAMKAYNRDLAITDKILAQDPSIPHLLAVNNNQYDWVVFLRCNHLSANVRERFARDLAELDRLAEEIFHLASRQLERAQANGHAQ